MSYITRYMYMYSVACGRCGKSSSWQDTLNLAWEAAEAELDMDPVADKDVCWRCRQRAAGGVS